MTDLERAHAFMREHFDCQDVICTFALGCGCAAQLADALAAARREGAEAERNNIDEMLEVAYQHGAEEMRERAARLHENINVACDHERQHGAPGAGAMGAVIRYRDAIRALKDKDDG